MNQLELNTAILLFSYTAEEESKRKQLVNSKSNLKFFNLLSDRTNEVIEGSSLPVFKFSKSDQRGDTFGQRVSNAFAEVFAKGFERVICIGNDCPELATEDIQKASEELETSDIVLGPDFRGGFFLMGLNREAFEKSAFENLNWQSNSLVQSFLRYSLGYTLHFLEPKFDLNNKLDIVTYAPKSKILTKLLKIVFKGESSSLIVFDNDKPNQELTTQEHRGPPCEV